MLDPDGNNIEVVNHHRYPRRDPAGAVGADIDRNLEVILTDEQLTPIPGIDPAIAPSGTGCVECLAGEGAGWWLHLRRCAQCGHIGCCDASPSRHARAHAADEGHPYVRSFEPGEDWFYSFPDEAYIEGAELTPPNSHPLHQPVPGPAGKVPPNWRQELR